MLLQLVQASPSSGDRLCKALANCNAFRSDSQFLRRIANCTGFETAPHTRPCCYNWCKPRRPAATDCARLWPTATPSDLIPNSSGALRIAQALKQRLILGHAVTIGASLAVQRRQIVQGFGQLQRLPI